MPEVFEGKAKVRQRTKQKSTEMCPEKHIDQEVDEAAESNFRIDEILATIRAYLVSLLHWEIGEGRHKITLCQLGN